MRASTIGLPGAGPGFGKHGIRALGLLPALLLLLCGTVLLALETPSKPFLDKNSFYLTSAGFRVQLANDEVGCELAQQGLAGPHRR